ncbi:hypothetical protein H696_02229 [Fonticula alba]|uniref:Ska2 N-terminal domain-containing protein n=1 Tax=Fonticula alba TaxID=691883 RepID=A0A058ZBI6_FONAL|nr:hypothetical protein H696_02229 [Fonticula alba]KCV71283.1 hypothetical protein H696_02229 [Fonticula alba]|eukprot:XP_009494406.1 hypothetical protein H696_02229 [Fonticula alba]
MESSIRSVERHFTRVEASLEHIQDCLDREFIQSFDVQHGEDTNPIKLHARVEQLLSGLSEMKSDLAALRETHQQFRDDFMPQMERNLRLMQTLSQATGLPQPDGVTHAVATLSAVLDASDTPPAPVVPAPAAAPADDPTPPHR